MYVRLRLIPMFAASMLLLHAQEYRATVSGNVTDPGGRPRRPRDRHQTTRPASRLPRLPAQMALSRSRSCCPVTDSASPLFGVVKITQINLPRSVELGFRYSF
jgi:hypothetical protein